MNLEALHKRVAEDLWASFGYDSPEEHAVFLTKLISDVYIKGFLADLEEFELKRYSDMMRTLKQLREKYEGLLKE